MRPARLLPLLVLTALRVFAAGYSLELTPENTKIAWTLGDVLHTVNGSFRLKRGAIDFDPENGKASGKVVVDVASGESGSATRDRRMHVGVLESAKYPEAVFVPERVEGAWAPAGPSEMRLSGTFTIHGAAHPMTMMVHASNVANQLATKIDFDIPYVAWGMKDPSNFLLKVNKTVQISIETAATLQKH